MVCWHCNPPGNEAGWWCKDCLHDLHPASKWYLIGFFGLDNGEVLRITSTSTLGDKEKAKIYLAAFVMGEQDRNGTD